MLNSKLAETESVMHDLIRDLASEKMDLANYKVKFGFNYKHCFLSNDWLCEWNKLQLQLYATIV